MKKILFILPLITCFACSDFLDERDQDKLVPEQPDHFAALLLQEFSFSYPLFKTIDHMTDNVVENALARSSTKQGAKTTYSWQREIEIDENGNELSNINNAWQNTYEDIAIANYVIELIDEASGEQTEKDFVKGEAYFIRALSYFNLLNLYGQPFNASTADTDLGVPLRLNIGVEMVYSRNTVAECYAQVESDILMANELFDLSGITKGKFHPSQAACNLLMSRVKLYQEEWDEVISYADLAIGSGSLTKMTSTTPFITETNPEVLYSYYTIGRVVWENATYVANTELINLYDDADIRKEAYFATSDNGSGNVLYIPKKYDLDGFSTLGFTNLRIGEAYLNRAEAYAQKENLTNAVNDIKALHAKRYTSTASVVYPTNVSEVLSFVLNERRKELCFEDHHRWFDLRRMANRPEIKHVFTLIGSDGVKTGTETFTLLSDDINYTLPIPLKERQNNPLIRNNERYEKIPVIDEEVIID
ncbi:RagB/SusD family nutrient uptake outer membrane protein [Aestuariibaculum lutulentum]|uniref:RagB/SusD family nutrient uptake outer membrane protein n=1 Tax=Aestuariibaculum lutulentum TaxID=2920935 RepID=A0ABS9RH82_9FLAO|nr:RagB/SusD family nutrient uptake outer membrane protein [Aestuariibaculum lutulentum]MCH4551457.1 RagB/SusD family nutrient uptake outer membrane protein [Aestuariibaculum lutulentum]